MGRIVQRRFFFILKIYLRSVEINYSDARTCAIPVIMRNAADVLPSEYVHCTH